MPTRNFTENRDPENAEQPGSEIPKYDPKVAKDLEEEHGLTENEAIRVAAAEMERCYGNRGREYLCYTNSL
jgi:hypothetical protein